MPQRDHQVSECIDVPALEVIGDSHGVPGAASPVWRALAEAGPGVVLLLNRDEICIYAGDGAADLLGVPPEQIVGTRPEPWVDVEHLPYLWRARSALTGGTERTTARLRVVGSDRRSRWVESTLTWVPDPPSGSGYLVVHLREVSVEVRLEAAVSRLEQRYAQLLASVDEFVFQVDARLAVEAANPAALRLLDRAADQVLGRPVLELLSLCDADGRPVRSGPDRGLPPALAALATRAGSGAWFSVGRGDGTRRLVHLRVASYPAPRPADTGHLLVMAPSTGQPPAVGELSVAQARAAARLTAREGDVLDGLAGGGDVPTIARQLGISVHSVRGHVKSITAKLGVHSQLQAVIAAVRRGLVDLGDDGTSPKR